MKDELKTEFNNQLEIQVDLITNKEKYKILDTFWKEYSHNFPYLL